eukprot:1405338-Pyramimonas_sp.AAC.2
MQASPALAKLRKSSDPKLDYSSIKPPTLHRQLAHYLVCSGSYRSVRLAQVELTTAEGLRKYQTECAPNGYYFIPVSDQGTFVIKVSGPEGWAFEPSEATVQVDANGQCGNGKDVDFQYTGFSVKGAVLGAVGPRKV